MNSNAKTTKNITLFRKDEGYFINDEARYDDLIVFLVLAATDKEPLNIDDTWIHFSYPLGEEGGSYFDAFGKALPILPEMMDFITHVVQRLWWPDFEVSKEGQASIIGAIPATDDWIREKEAYHSFIRRNGLCWNQTKHTLMEDAYPLDATAQNIKMLSGLDIDPLEIDPNQECNLGLFIIWAQL